MGGELLSFFIPVIPIYFLWCCFRVFQKRKQLMENKIEIYSLIVAIIAVVSIVLAPNYKAGLAFHGIFLGVYLLMTMPIIKLLKSKKNSGSEPSV
jgi:hypothetical protein